MNGDPPNEALPRGTEADLTEGSRWLAVKHGSHPSTRAVIERRTAGGRVIFTTFNKSRLRSGRGRDDRGKATMAADVFLARYRPLKPREKGS